MSERRNKPTEGFGTALDLILLAGGQGRRLGGCIKANICLEDDDTRLLSRNLRTYRPLVQHTFIVAPPSIATQLHLPEDKAVTIVNDEGLGPVQAVATAAKKATADGLWVAAVDHPFASPRLVARFCGLLSDDYDGVLVEDNDGRLQPFPALYRRKSWSLELSSVRSMREFLKTVRMKVVGWPELEPEERLAFEDIDDATDLRRYRARRPKSLS